MPPAQSTIQYSAVREASPHIRAYSHKELAVMYCCSRKTLSRWLQHIPGELGPRMGRLYTPRQVRLIFGHLGEP